VSVRTQTERGVMGRHHKISAYHFLPQKRGGQMDGIERAELGWHRLRRPFEDDGVNFHELRHKSVLSSGARRTSECQTPAFELNCQAVAVERSVRRFHCPSRVGQQSPL
jgi:hypothetical protein